MHRRLALALLSVSAAVLAGAAAAASAKVDAAALRPAQVGAGYVVPTESISRSLNEPTLDLCFRRFASEARRVERLQLGYSRLDVEDVSNEVVRYRPGGAKLALKEAASIACTNKKSSGAFDSTTMTARRVRPKGAPAGSVTLTVRIVNVHVGQRFELIGAGVYLVRGDVLSGVYAFDDESPPIARAVRLAKLSAANLKRAG